VVTEARNETFMSTTSNPPPAPPPQPAHATSISDALSHWGADRERGLTDDEARSRLEKYGRNELAQAPPVAWWKKLLGQFNSLVVWILIVAAIIAGAMSEWIDTVAILAIVALNGVLGFLQEAKAEQALEALKKMSSPMAKVLRGGHLVSVPASEVVPGDIVELEAGDLVPADARLVQAFGLRVTESALTGESVPTEKEADQVAPVDTPIGDRSNMVFMGTVVSGGKATAVVVGTGMNTELGHIAGLLEREEAELTPLQRRLEELGRVLVVVCLALVAVIFVLQLLRGGDLLTVLLLAISLGVAAVPEGLPAVVTMALALGLQRMAKRNALVRKLPSVETLGSVTTICSDKTGTLTRNEMTVRAIVVGDAWYDVTGTGYAPEGTFKRRRLADGNRDHAEEVDPLREVDLVQALTIAVRCNHAELQQTAEGWKVIGDPTEGALLTAARKGKLALNKTHLMHEIPFDSQRKRMSIALTEGDHVVVYSKGAPEVVLAACGHQQRDGQVVPLGEDDRRKIEELNGQLAAQALRVLAVAYRRDSQGSTRVDHEEDLVFCGLIGMIDPPREEAKAAVQECYAAGIRPVMITGDHPATALAIGRELGIARGEAPAMTGRDLDGVDDAALAKKVEQIGVFARVSAEHKLRVVKALKSRGHVVAMTGDGVNDGPAVKAADIGIAMGITGTDVTKEASDMVLTDDNFATIVNAVEEGRGIFDNIQKFVFYLLSSNAGEVLLMFVAALVGWPAPLAAIQILWINLVTDGLPALALAMEPPERDIMQRPPRPPHEPVITWSRGLQILFNGSLIAGVTLAGFWWVYRGDEAQLGVAQSVAFGGAALSQLVFSFACRSQRYTLPELGLFTNPYILTAMLASTLLQVAVMTVPFLAPFFEVKASVAEHWLLLVVMAILPTTVIELGKLAIAAGRRIKGK